MEVEAPISGDKKANFYLKIPDDTKQVPQFSYTEPFAEIKFGLNFSQKLKGFHWAFHFGLNLKFPLSERSKS